MHVNACMHVNNYTCENKRLEVCKPSSVTQMITLQQCCDLFSESLGTAGLRRDRSLESLGVNTFVIGPTRPRRNRGRRRRRPKLARGRCYDTQQSRASSQRKRSNCPSRVWPRARSKCADGKKSVTTTAANRGSWPRQPKRKRRSPRRRPRAPEGANL